MTRPRSPQLGLDAPGKLFLGDNLEVLRHHVADESVDLVYLDPPFNSNKSYNLLFAHQDGRAPAAQIKAFGDTWRWDEAASALYREVVQQGGDVSRVLRAFREFLGGAGTSSGSDMLAYLTMMAPRLVELKRVLKPTGSIYLHCDPNASHYLKMLMDGVFGPANFRGEIHWRRTSSHNDSRRWPQIHDTLLFYAFPGFTWNPAYLSHDPEYVRKFYRYTDDRGRYRLHEIIRTASMGPRPNLAYEYMGYIPEWGWRTERPKLEALDADRRIEWGSSGRPYLKRYLHEQQGTPASSLWVDIPPVSAKAQERMGYPTQKPLALLERILSASSNPGEVVLDPFCGCGTAVDAAQRLDRRWIGIDITVDAIRIIEDRLHAQFGEIYYSKEIEPSSIDEAIALAAKDKIDFQRWACAKLGITSAVRRGADRGIDGELVGVYDSGESWKALVSVKGGAVGPTALRDLHGVVIANGAETGILVTLRHPTNAMRRAVADAGFNESGLPVLQILTIEELLNGKRPQLPLATARVLEERQLRAV